MQLALYAPALLLTVAILGLPLDIWNYALDRRFGISVQSWRSWGSDWITGQLIALLIGTVVVALVYTAIRRSPRRWWRIVWVVSIPLILAAFVVQPLVIDPLFFTFSPLAPGHPDLADGLTRVMRHGGVDIPPERMFVMNASTKTTALNAYVAGLGPSKRAVIGTRPSNRRPHPRCCSCSVTRWGITCSTTSPKRSP